MIKDVSIFLSHISDAIDSIESFVGKYTKEDFLKDEKVRYAVVRGIEIIGEAVKNIPSSFTSKYIKVPWKDVAGMRDKLIHNYFGVNYELVWKTIKEDLPSLKKEIKKILDEEKKNART